MKCVRFILLIILAISINSSFCQFSQDTLGKYVFVDPEKLPEFPGGINALMKFIIDNLKYPQNAKDSLIEGKMIVKFLIDKDGSLSKFKILQGIGGGCNEEALRVAKLMPKWKPCMNSGIAYPYYFTLPIKFTLH